MGNISLYVESYVIIYVYFIIIICNRILLFIIFFFEFVGYKYIELFLKFVEGFLILVFIENWVKVFFVLVL